MKLKELVKCGRQGCGHKADNWSRPCPDDGCIRLKREGDDTCIFCMANAARLTSFKHLTEITEDASGYDKEFRLLMLNEALELLNLATSEREARQKWLMRVIKARSLIEKLIKGL